MDKTSIITSILTGIAAAVLLAGVLVSVVAAVKERNWNRLLELMVGYMACAETMSISGAERKAWVLDMLRASANTINYDRDITTISKLIDSLCDLTKVVNNERMV